MRTLHLASLLLIALCAFAIPVRAQQPKVEATPIPRDLKPNFTSMRFLAGTWSCTVASSRRPATFHEAVSTTFSPDGYWMLTRTITEKVPWNPITITRDDRITYDPTTARWIDLGSDDYGLYDVSASPGWNGNAITRTDLVYPRSHAVKTNNPLVF